MRRRCIVGALVTLGLVVSGCSTASGPNAGEQAALEAELAEEYDGAILTVNALDDIEDAELYESDGVSFQLPMGWIVDRTEHDDFVHLQAYDPDDELNIVGITVAEQATSDGDVLVETDGTFAHLAIRGVEDLERHLVEWDTWPFAIGITGVVPRDDADDSNFVSIGGRDGAGSLRVGMSATTSDVTMEDSLQYKVLRSIRPSE